MFIFVWDGLGKLQKLMIKYKIVREIFVSRLLKHHSTKIPEGLKGAFNRVLIMPGDVISGMAVHQITVVFLVWWIYGHVMIVLHFRLFGILVWNSCKKFLYTKNACISCIHNYIYMHTFSIYIFEDVRSRQYGTEGLEGAFNWTPMMPESTSLQGSPCKIFQSGSGEAPIGMPGIRNC